MSDRQPVISPATDWPVGPLGELVTLLRRGTAPVYVDDSDVKAIGQRCVTATDFDPSFARHHSPRSIVGTLSPEVGDVLINSTGTGTIGRSVLFREDGTSYIVDGHVTVARPRSGVLVGRWLNDTLRSPEGQRYLEARCYAGSTNQVELSSSALAAMPIAVPMTEEQARVAKVLDAFDDQVRAGKELVSKLNLLSRGLADRLLCDVGDDEELPSGWSFSTVGDVYEVQAGITLGPDRAPRRNSTGYLRVANVQRSAIDLGDIARLQASPVERAKYGLKSGDLLVVEGHADVNQIGRCARVPEEAEGLVYQNHLFRLRSTQVNQVFGEAWLNSKYARQYWRRTCSSSSGLNTINSKQLRAMRVAVPPFQEQERIAAALAGMAARIESEQQALDKLVLQKAGLLADLLSGRVRVPVEVAS